MTQTGADIIGAALAEAGATHAFGIPGGEVLAVMQGLDAAGIRFVLTKHENAAGFMAEGHWHATGALPVLVATLGPGVANAVNVVANAEQDKVPLIFLTGCVDGEEAKSYTHQVFDHAAMLRPITKASLRAETGKVGEVMARAIAIAQEGQPGPVHVDVPITVAEGASPGDAVIAPRLAQADAEGDLDRARALLNAAQCPVAIAGVDAVNQGAGPAIAAFCRARGIPLITTYKGKGLLDESDPLALGGAGLSPKADDLLLPLIRQSDGILLLGYDPIEMRIGWRNPWSADQTVIEVTEVPRSHGMHSVSLTLTGQIAPMLDEFGTDGGPVWTEEPAKTRQALKDMFSADGWGPAKVFEILREVMPPETVVTADSGAHRILLSQIWSCPSPRGMLQSTGLCTMACSVPLAMGHAMGREVPVVAFVGDAGLEMGLGELATLRDLGLPVIVCVLVDESLALIEMKQRGSQRANLGVDFGGTDFVGVAQAMGGHGAWIDDVASLTREAEVALGRDGFTLLACRIGRRAYDGTF
ncbi:thiamine pyrophosphate-binding protein [Halovulum sp. GXIMD14793]